MLFGSCEAVRDSRVGRHPPSVFSSVVSCYEEIDGQERVLYRRTAA